MSLRFLERNIVYICLYLSTLTLLIKKHGEIKQ